MGMLPAPWAITGLPEHLAFHALLEPAKEVGGDLYDAFMLDKDHFFFIVGDVAGKGVPASLFMALSKTLCKSLALRQRVPLDALITALNHEVARDNPQALFVTAIAVSWMSALVRWNCAAPAMKRPFCSVAARPPVHSP